MPKPLLKWAAAIFLAVALHGQTIPKVSVSGRLATAERLGGIPGGQVTAMRVAAPVAGFVPSSASVQAGADGAFSFTALEGGSYVFCGAAPWTNRLDPCEWEKPVRVDLAPGAVMNNLLVLMKEGKGLRFRVDDPGSHIASRARGSGIGLAVGVWTPDGNFHTAPVIARKGNGQDHWIAVPFDTDLGVGIHGAKLDVRDESGGAIRASDAPKRVRIPKSEGPGERIVRMSIRGRTP